MKRIVAVLVMVAMLFSITSVAFAAGSFVESPSKKRAPIVIDFKTGSGCTGRLVITGYADRATLPTPVREALETAYTQIKNSKDVSALCAALAGVASNKNIKTTSLAVSELFDISVEGCTEHENHHNFDITIAPESLVGFVGLMHFRNGAWELVTDAKVENNGEHLTFSVETLSPFAIVVNTEELVNPNPTGDTLTYVLMAVAVLAAAGLVVVAISSKRKQI